MWQKARFLCDGGKLSGCEIWIFVAKPEKMKTIDVSVDIDTGEIFDIPGSQADEEAHYLSNVTGHRGRQMAVDPAQVELLPEFTEFTQLVDSRQWWQEQTAAKSRPLTQHEEET